MEKQTLVLIIINKLEQSPWKIRLAGALNQIAEVLASSSFLHFDRNIFFSVGKIYGELDQLSESYKNARDSLYIQRKFGKPALLFFDDLHIHRLIIALEKTGDLESLVCAYLQPLLKNGFKAEQALIDTLTALRDTQYNKIEAAKQLFISRQSIYLRIKTLEGLLGEDFITSPQKRICLETALYGLEYLNNESAFLSSTKQYRSALFSGY
jgi:PucR family transcriptional regulator, purine catabolism regulatory protein